MTFHFNDKYYNIMDIMLFAVCVWLNYMIALTNDQNKPTSRKTTWPWP